MKKKILIVNILFLLFLFEFLFFPRKTFAQSVPSIPTVTLTPSSANNNQSLELLKKLLNLLFSFGSISSTYPSNSTTAPTPIGSIGSTAPSITPSSTDPVSYLVYNVKTHCGGYVNSSTYGCLTTSNFPPPTDSAVPEFQSSVQTYGTLQCVSFTKAVANMVDGVQWGHVGDAIGLLSSTLVTSGKYRAIYRWSGEPIQVGDYAVYDYDTYGHVAYVVDATTTRFVVAEANWYSFGDVNNTRPDTINNPDLKGWLRKL